MWQIQPAFVQNKRFLPAAKWTEDSPLFRVTYRVVYSYLLALLVYLFAISQLTKHSSWNTERQLNDWANSSIRSISCIHLVIIFNDFIIWFIQLFWNDELTEWRFNCIMWFAFAIIHFSSWYKISAHSVLPIKQSARNTWTEILEFSFMNLFPSCFDDLHYVI